MRARFPLLELILAMSASFACALLALQVMPFRYGTAVDLIAGRRLEYWQMLGITYKTQPHWSILSVYYEKYVGSLPDEKQWAVESSAVQLPDVLQPLLPAPPLPRQSPLTDAIVGISSLLARQEVPGGAPGRLTPQARAAVIERTLAVARLSGRTDIAFDYVRGLQQQFDKNAGEFGPGSFPTAEQYLAGIQASN
jgi:hypothetical protein